MTCSMTDCSTTHPPTLPRGTGWVLLGMYGVMCVMSVALLRSPGVMPAGNELSLERAVFGAVNVCTLTGFSTTTGQHDLRPAGQLIVTLLNLGATLLVLAVGALGVNRWTEARCCERRLMLGVVGTVTLGLLLGTVGLMISGVDALQAAKLSLAALSNTAGVSGVPGATDWRLHAMLLPLMLAGGLGTVVLLQMFDALRGRGRLSGFSRVALTSTALVYVVAVGLILMLMSMSRMDVPVTEALASASVNAVNARGTGWSVEPLSGLPRAVQGALTGLMSVGAVVGGTAGGIGLLTLYAIGAGARATLAGRIAPRATVFALLWLGAFIVTVFVTFLILLGTESTLAPDRVLFLSVAAVSNVGMSHEPLSITGTGLWTLSLAMLVGKFLPLALLLGVTKIEAGQHVLMK